MCRVADSTTLKLKVCDPARGGESEAYILTHESDPREAATSAISLTELRTIITDQAAQFGRVLAFIDVCHAAITEFPKTTQPDPTQIESKILTRRGKIGVMSAITKADDRIGLDRVDERASLVGFQDRCLTATYDMPRTSHR